MSPHIKRPRVPKLQINKRGDRFTPGPIDMMLVQRDAHGCLHEHHHAFDQLVWLAADQDGHMQPDDTVLGLALGEAAYALPWWIMKNHHVANLVLEGRPLMVVLCEACAGASANDATVNGVRHTFRVEGKYNGTHVLIDHETGSLWMPFGAVAVHGPLQGSRLLQLPLLQCTWEEWRRLYPHTRVPDGSGESRTGHGSRYPNPDVCGRVEAMQRTIVHVDERLDAQELVFGVHAGELARAYLLAQLHAGPVVRHGQFAGRELVIFCPRGSWLAIAFHPELDGRTLYFAPLRGSDLFEDRETGSYWNINGRALAGPLAGRALPYVPCGIEKWYAWSAAHPGAEIAPGT